MCEQMQRQFISVHSRRQLEREIEMAEALIEADGTAFPDCTFEDGYIAALKFVMNMEGSNVREEYEEMMNEGAEEAN
ncbi:TPA: hypothetical protein JG825_005218 [Vibrio parahaemolyticus]|uniref:hypothetical protein n=1 Tax=Vibrio TaxID=662 RepID=UPI001FAEC058|nr:MULTISPECIES: hypothetical protein [Vibrio]MCJ0803033.1 hypothetical protein [Vibrio vulnificus]MDF5594963.1 hypothetical protein [Vibrio parahaemolyticus]UPR17266.1 hypothetical protein H9J99_21000 [Vibrio parahaemolyticus]UPR23249.1 hypothetical protein H9J98_18020 [Vibrio parahaemolyticus]HAV1517139.1 hypothetical protein [Vibrio parahaemolyticus]